ncbi:MAG: cupin domain-containing protein [Ktedonobacterales bacterium]|jgi:quercetin dioxygenase-like cupin family protein
MDAPVAQVIDLAALDAAAVAAGGQGAVWSLVTTDLNLNLIRLHAGDAIAEHVNAELDVIGLVVSGAGVLEVDGQAFSLAPECLFFIPQGARRAFRAGDTGLTYVTCHRRRPALFPRPRQA